MIVHHNLHSLPIEQVDFHYLAVINDEAYPSLIAFYGENTTIAKTVLTEEEWDDIFTLYNWKRNQLRMKKLETTWRSCSLYEYDLLKRLEAVYPTYLSIIHP